MEEWGLRDNDNVAIPIVVSTRPPVQLDDDVPPALPEDFLSLHHIQSSTPPCRTGFHLGWPQAGKQQQQFSSNFRQAFNWPPSAEPQRPCRRPAEMWLSCSSHISSVSSRDRPTFVTAAVADCRRQDRKERNKMHEIFFLCHSIAPESGKGKVGEATKV